MKAALYTTLFCSILLSSLTAAERALLNTGKGARGILIEAEDFDKLEQYPWWAPVKDRWYAKEHLVSTISGGAYAVANEYSIGAVMEKKLDKELPPGKYNVWLRVAILAASDDAVEVELNGVKQVYAWTIATKPRNY